MSADATQPLKVTDADGGTVSVDRYHIVLPCYGRDTVAAIERRSNVITQRKTTQH